MASLAWLLLAAPTSYPAPEACVAGNLADTAISAALGEVRGTYDLGVEFYTGRCVAMSHANAAMLWEKAAAMGSVAAKHNLGFLLFKGLGVPRDEARAVSLWEEVALMGHAEAQVHLGAALFDGRGRPQDRELGMAWVLRAMESARANADTPDEAGGPAILAMAQEELQAMQEEEPGLLERATELARGLVPPPSGG